MTRMASRRTQADAEADLAIRYPSGRVVVIEVKNHRRNVSVRDYWLNAALHISGASAGAVGAASFFGWYVRTNAPWSGREDAIQSDWQTVGDDIWRAAGDIAHKDSDSRRDQHLFDPSAYSSEKLST